MSLKYSILGLLHYRSLHGYRIKEVIEQNFGYMWSINYGQIYPNLKRMLEENLISVQEENLIGRKGPPRKLYSITPKGEKDFSRWLASSPERAMLLRDPFLMRFVFFGFGSKENALKTIEEQIEKYETQLELRERNRERWKGDDLYVSLMVDLGVKMNKMFLDWLRTAKTRVMASNDS